MPLGYVDKASREEDAVAAVSYHCGDTHYTGTLVIKMRYTEYLIFYATSMKVVCFVFDRKMAFSLVNCSHPYLQKKF